MAEKIVSPGVFTRERDLSYLTEGVSEIGAVIIGPFLKGPAFIPTVVETQVEFERIYGTPNGTFYTPYAVQSYLREASTITVVRVGGIGGYTQAKAIVLRASGSTDNVVAVLFNSATGASPLYGFTSASVTQSGVTPAFVLESGSEWTYSASLSTGSADYIENVFGTSPLGSKEPYVHTVFKDTLGTSYQGSDYTMSIDETVDQVFSNDAVQATTPWIRSQLISDDRFNLFKLHTHGMGNAANTEIKASIESVKKAGTLASTLYGTFTLVIREYSDTDSTLSVLETFAGLTLDPNDPNYISRIVGDRYTTIASDGKLTETGDWVNNSNYVRVEVTDSSTYPTAAIPAAIASYQLPVSITNGILLPVVTFITTSVDDTTTYSGFDFTLSDNEQYVNPIPTSAGTGSNDIFCLDSAGSGETSAVAAGLDLTLTTSTEIAKRQFSVAFQGGFDGMALNISASYGEVIAAGNTQGFDLSSSTASGSVAYIKAINAVSNPDEFDINLLAMPGVIRRLHTAVITSAITMCETRGDCFFVADFAGAGDTTTQVIAQSDAVDSSYVGHYYPWIKIVDANTNQLLSVPPSVVLPGVFAANDRVAAEWYAPAGLNRGGITGAVKVLNRLTHSERDDLYESRVNPIATFPGQGIAVWGQKTCQNKASALDIQGI